MTVIRLRALCLRLRYALWGRGAQILARWKTRFDPGATRSPRDVKSLSLSLIDSWQLRLTTGQKRLCKKGASNQPPQPPPLHEWFCEARFAASSFA